MSGHSKWANIKRKKEVNDKARGSLFSKLSRAITLAVIEGGGMPDPALNVKLRLAVEKAKQENMPKDNIQRAIEKGAGPDKALLKEQTYEAFGPGGAALIITVTTDNSNRTNGEVKNNLDRNGGKLGNQGSVSYLFQHCGVVVFSKKENSVDDILVFADSIGSLDFEEDEENVTVYIPFEKLGHVKDQLGNLKASVPEVDYKPISTVELSAEDQKKLVELIEALENLDDVQNVYTNAVFN